MNDNTAAAAATAATVRSRRRPGDYDFIVTIDTGSRILTYRVACTVSDSWKIEHAIDDAIAAGRLRHGDIVPLDIMQPHSVEALLRKI